ncbi:MAG: hypothetical protein WCX71_04955 [Candidatus Buchananbacteria bacterium]
MATERSASEVKARCKSVLDKPKLIHLVQQSNSPTAAYTVVLAETGSGELAKAGRWLAVLRRDYPEEYESIIVSTNPCQAKTARQEQEKVS